MYVCGGERGVALALLAACSWEGLPHPLPEAVAAPQLKFHTLERL